MLIKRNLKIRVLYRKEECDSEKLKKQIKKEKSREKYQGKKMSQMNYLKFLLYFTCCVLSCLSCVQLFATLWTVGYGPQAPMSMGFSKQEYWVGLPWSPPSPLWD